MEFKINEKSDESVPHWEWLGKDDAYCFGVRLNKKGSGLLKECLTKALNDLGQNDKESPERFVKCESQNDSMDSPILIHGVEPIEFVPPQKEKVFSLLKNIFTIIFLLAALSFLLFCAASFFTGLYALSLDVYRFFKGS